jgi:endonuclease/exonuclease/phosphatase family metal-dependent hydrolase
VRLLTWNTWFSERAFRERTIGLLRAITAGNYDVIALQEVTLPLRTLLAEVGARTGYRLHALDNPMGYDVALLARDRDARLSELPLPTQMGRRALAITLSSGVTVATVHLESLPPYAAARVAQLALIGPWLAQLSPAAAVLCGDLNFDDFDAREADVLDDAYVDVWPLLHPGEPGYTIDSAKNPMRGGGPKARVKHQRRLDRVFVRGERIVPTSIALVGTEPIAPGVHVSDHFGLAVDLDVR